MKNIKFLGLAFAAAAAFAAAPAQAASWTVESPVVAAGVGTLVLNGHTFTFSDPASPVLDVAFYNANPGSNSQASIATFIKASNLFSLSPSTVLANGAAANFGGGTITSATPFDYLAVHIGGGELLFHWSSKITSFNLTGESLSNFRAYAAPIPEPETYAMMIAGLGLVGFMARRRKQA
jgi:hypothetical protein